MGVYTNLLLLLLYTTQQHIHQDVGKKVNGHSVVMLNDESAAVKNFTCQLMPHLKHNKCHNDTLTGHFQKLELKRKCIKTIPLQV